MMDFPVVKFINCEIRRPWLTCLVGFPWLSKNVMV